MQSTTVRLEGRVLDEQQHPVEGARIALTSTENITAAAARATADASGSFSLSLELPASWRRLTLRVEREGYESVTRDVGPDQATRALLLKTYRSLTISPAESIEAVVLEPFLCGMAGNPCRRVMVDSPSGELVDLQVFPADGQLEVGLERTQFGWGVDLPRRLTVAGGGEVWIVVGQPGRVRLRAAGR